MFFEHHLGVHGAATLIKLYSQEKNLTEPNLMFKPKPTKVLSNVSIICSKSGSIFGWLEIFLPVGLMGARR